MYTRPTEASIFIRLFWTVHTTTLIFLKDKQTILDHVFGCDIYLLKEGGYYTIQHYVCVHTETKRTSNRCEVKPEVIEDCETYGTLPDGSCLKRRVVDHGGEGTCIKEEDFVPPKIGPLQDYPPKLYRVIKDLKPGSKKYKQCCGKNRPAPPKSDRYHIEVNYCQEVELDCHGCFRGCS